MPQKFYITTPIYYVNDRPHIGHVYTTTIADIVARYHRLRGDDVFFLTGVDEHAAKVVDAAGQRGLTAQQWADQNAAVFQETFAKLGITHDDFVRTTQDRHKSKVQEYLAALQKTGDVYEGEYEGWYDAGQEEYVTDSNAEKQAFKSAINGKPLVKKREKNYFFRLSAYRQALLDLYAANPGFVQPEARKNEIVNRIAEAVDVPISRSGAGGWGIPFPGAPGDAPQTVYVWIDALFNYLSFVDTPERRPYWQSGAPHLIAKDILWFHASIWPALLMALRKCPGYDWVCLPRMIYAHSFWISEGQKMSKSLGNFIDLEKIDSYVSTFSLDALRYFLASNGPLGTTDSDFAEAKFAEVFNADLANTLGNCISRVATMTTKYYDGKVPSLIPLDEQDAFHASVLNFFDVTNYVDVVFANYGSLRVGIAASLGCALVKDVDAYIGRTEPFKVAKNEVYKATVANILYNCAEALRIASLLLWPVMPTKVEELWRRLGCDYAEQMTAPGAGRRGKLDEWVKWGQLQPGTPILTGDALFPRHQPK